MQEYVINFIKKVKNSNVWQENAPKNTSAFAPLVLCLACMVLGLLSTIINRFIFTFSDEILSPILCQIIILLIPIYLYLLLRSPQKSFIEQMRWLGIRRLYADYIFFLIFASFFMMTSSLLLNIIFGGVFDTSGGFSLLGTIVAGRNEFVSSDWYLIFSYAIIPAFIEEIFFRGLLFREFAQNGKKFAIALSTIIFAIFAFSPGQIPSAIACGLVYSLARSVTGTLQGSIIIHLIFNLYGLFLQTNISQYYLSSQNNALLLIMIIFAFLLSGVLFFGELARIYRARAKHGKKAPNEDTLTLDSAKKTALSLFSHRPTLIVSIACIVLYIATVVIEMI